MSEELIKLAERCEKAEGPDRELDDTIAAELFTGKHRVCVKGLSDEAGGMWMFTYPNGSVGSSLRFTASLDAAMTLVPEGMTFSVDQGPAHWIVTGKAKSAGRAQVYRLNPDRDEETGLNAELVEYGFAATPALALVAACLRARATPEHPHEG